MLSIFGMLVMVVDPLLDEDNSHRSLGTVALIGTLAALASTLFMARPEYAGTAFSNMVRVDGFSVFFHFLVIAIAAVVILSSYVIALTIFASVCDNSCRLELIEIARVFTRKRRRQPWVTISLMR